MRRIPLVLGAALVVVLALVLVACTFTHLHFFIGGCDWYIAEYDGKDTFFGFAILNNDDEMAEWGYVSFRELKEIRIDGWLEVDCETEELWQIRKASEIEKIRKAHGWSETGTRRLVLST